MLVDCSIQVVVPVKGVPSWPYLGVEPDVTGRAGLDIGLAVVRELFLPQLTAYLAVVGRKVDGSARLCKIHGKGAWQAWVDVVPQAGPVVLEPLQSSTPLVPSSAEKYFVIESPVMPAGKESPVAFVSSTMKVPDSVP